MKRYRIFKALKSNIRFLKWAGLVLSVLILIWMPLSKQYGFWLGIPNPFTSDTSTFSIATGAGFAGCVYEAESDIFESGFHYESGIDEFSWWFNFDLNSDYIIFAVPLWLFFLLTAIPTYILWRYYKNYPDNCCQECGYNLTGNTTGKCPECGVKIICHPQNK